jgi:SAM-dependent methyltransferase
MNIHINGTVLELGGYSHPGLALVFLLYGAKKYYLNNITPVENRIPLSYAQNVFALMELSLSTKKKLFDVVEKINETDDVRIKDELIYIISEEDASNISLPDNSIDFLFSMTVLEHVKTTAPVLKNCLRLLKPGGYAYHNIDLRDHTDFKKPLDFLQWSSDEFDRRQPFNNRLRACDHRREFEKIGYSIDDVTYVTPLPTLTNNNRTDCFYQLSNHIDDIFSEDTNKVNVWVTENLRQQFDPQFHSYSLDELSITGVIFCIHKPCKMGQENS